MVSSSYHWIEDWFGNMWQFRDGVNIQNRQHYCCNKRASCADTTYTGDFEKVGYVCPTNEGYIKKMGYNSLHPEYELPVDVGGGADSYVGDYYYSSEGGTLVFSGGRVDYGAFASKCYTMTISGKIHFTAFYFLITTRTYSDISFYLSVHDSPFY